MLRLSWNADARRQFAATIDYIAARNVDAADHIERLFDTGLERVCRFPQSARPGRVAGTRELIVHPNYMVVYRISDDAIIVLRILHAHQRYP